LLISNKRQREKMFHTSSEREKNETGRLERKNYSLPTKSRLKMEQERSKEVRKEANKGIDLLRNRSSSLASFSLGLPRRKGQLREGSIGN